MRNTRTKFRCSAAYHRACNGTVKEWDRVTEHLRLALEEMGRPYVISEGDGAFYGPKIDFHIQDSLGRSWQGGAQTAFVNTKKPRNTPKTTNAAGMATGFSGVAAGDSLLFTYL